MVGEDGPGITGTLFLGHLNSFHCSTDTVTTRVRYLGEPSEAEKKLKTHFSPGQLLNSGFGIAQHPS